MSQTQKEMLQMISDNVNILRTEMTDSVIDLRNQNKDQTQKLMEVYIKVKGIEDTTVILKRDLMNLNEDYKEHKKESPEVRDKVRDNYKWIAGCKKHLFALYTTILGLFTAVIVVLIERIK